MRSCIEGAAGHSSDRLDAMTLHTMSVRTPTSGAFRDRAETLLDLSPVRREEGCRLPKGAHAPSVAYLRCAIMGMAAGPRRVSTCVIPPRLKVTCDPSLGRSSRGVPGCLGRIGRGFFWDLGWGGGVGVDDGDAVGAPSVQKSSVAGCCDQVLLIDGDGDGGGEVDGVVAPQAMSHGSLGRGGHELLVEFHDVELRPQLGQPLTSRVMLLAGDPAETIGHGQSSCGLDMGQPGGDQPVGSVPQVARMSGTSARR